MSYSRTPNWSWQYFPPPYDFLAPPRIVPFNGVVLPEETIQMGDAGLNGLRGLGCGSDCGCGPCKAAGLGDDTTFPPIPAPGTDFGSTILADLQTFGSDLASSSTSLLQPLSQDTIAGLPAWVLVGGVVAAYLMFFSGGSHSRASRARRSVKRRSRQASSFLFGD